jgi:hypothetical protein
VGEGVDRLTIDDRLTIANMTTEWGALAGTPPCGALHFVTPCPHTPSRDCTQVCSPSTIARSGGCATGNRTSPQPGPSESPSHRMSMATASILASTLAPSRFPGVALPLARAVSSQRDSPLSRYETGAGGQRTRGGPKRVLRQGARAGPLHRPSARFRVRRSSLSLSLSCNVERA